VIELSDNMKALLCDPGRRGVMQVYVEGIPEVLCTEEPVDAKTVENSLDFDGTNDAVATGTITDLVGTTGDITIVIWFKPAAIGGGLTSHTLFTWHDGSEGWAVYFSDGTGTIVIEVGGAQYSPETLAGLPILITDDRWHCLVISAAGVEGVEVRALLLTMNADGTLASKQEGAVSATGDDRTVRAGYTVSTPVILGRDRSAANYFEGLIGYVAVYDRAFTRSEQGRIAYRVIDEKWTGFWEHLRAQWTLTEGPGFLARNSASTGSDYNIDTFNGGVQWSSEDPFTLAYKPLMTPTSAIGQDLEPRAARTTVSGLGFRVLDTDDWLTARLKEIGKAVKGRSAYVFFGLEGLLEDEYILVMNGAIEAIEPLSGRGYEVRIADAKRFVKTSFTLGKTKLSSGITNADTTIAVDSLINFNGLTGADRAGGGQPSGYIRIDDEIILYENFDDSPKAFLCAGAGRGALGTTAAAHSSGAAVEEIFVLAGVNPINFVLAMLLSGLGNHYIVHDGSTTGYDYLCRFATADGLKGEGRGAGMSPADIDMDAFEDFAGSITHTGDFVILEDIDDTKTWLEENVLKQLGAYFFVRSDGRLSIGSWDDPPTTGNVDVPTIEHGDMTRPLPSVDYSSILNNFVSRYDLDPRDGTYANVIASEDVDSGAAHGRSGVLRMDSPWIRTNDLATGATPFSPTPATIVAALATMLFDRFGDPQTLLEITTSLWFMTLEIGDGVYVQHEDVPDLEAGARGILGELFQVVGRTWDPARSRVVLRVMRVPE